MLKDFVHQFQHEKEIFDLKKKGISDKSVVSNKNSFINDNIIDDFLFVTAIISLVVMTIVIYIVCRHTKLKSLVTSLALQK